MSLPHRLVSLNIEGHRHLDLVVNFINEYQPDVVCLQEVFRVDAPGIARAVGMEVVQFVPLVSVQAATRGIPDALGDFGLLQLVRSSALQPAGSQLVSDGPTSVPSGLEVGCEHYVGDPKIVPVYVSDDNPDISNRAVAWLRLPDGTTIATTHFTWVPDGQATSQQHYDLVTLNMILQPLREFVLCGDFNAPRGKTVFDALATRYKDNIPAHEVTSIDGQFHKAGQLMLMVDGLFSTPAYQVRDVQLISGVSDHKAIIATVVK